MPPRPFINDALWRCLCPKYAQRPAPPRAASLRIHRTTEPPHRKFHGSPLKPAATATTTATADPFESNASGSHGFDTRRGSPPGVRSSRKTKGSVSLVRLPNSELYERLRAEGAAGNHEEVMNIIKILIKDRDERPNLPMYTALIHSYTNSQLGTAGKIGKALEDTQQAGIQLDDRAVECLLEALAVHPDSFLRTDILEYLRERWINLSPRGHNFVVAGLLRERCFEQALERLEYMVMEKLRIEDWLWDKTMWMLLEFGEVEEAFNVLNLRQSVQGENAKVSPSLYVQLLDLAGKKHIHEAASLIWHTRVVPGYIKATTGTCLNILALASRVGDVNLATDVFRVLGERGTVFTTEHYEELVACYLVAQDLRAALSAILIMQESNLRVSENELHPLVMYLGQEDSRPMDAFLHLRELEGTGKKIPTAVVNVCIRGSIKRKNLSEAIEIYKALHTVCRAGPNTQTFNDLFRGCHKEARKELAMYLASEMIELGIKPDRITYDRLMLVCLTAGDVNDALLYYEELRAQDWYPRRGTHEDLIEAALKARDGRCVALLNQYKEREYAVQARVATLERAVYKQFEQSGEAKEVMKISDGPQGGAIAALEALQKEMDIDQAENPREQANYGASARA